MTALGTAPRSTDEAEAAVDFSCSEAMQNVAKRAGRGARVTLSLDHDRGTLVVRVQDDGRGFDPVGVQEGAGLGNIRDGINTLGAGVELGSNTPDAAPSRCFRCPGRAGGQTPSPATSTDTNPVGSGC